MPLSLLSDYAQVSLGQYLRNNQLTRFRPTTSVQPCAEVKTKGFGRYLDLKLLFTPPATYEAPSSTALLEPVTSIHPPTIRSFGNSIFPLSTVLVGEPQDNNKYGSWNIYFSRTERRSNKARILIGACIDRTRTCNSQFCRIDSSCKALPQITTR